MSEGHIHDCTGPDATCHCGYKFTVMPISFALEVFDGQREIINDAFNTTSLSVVIEALQDWLEKLEAAELDEMIHAVNRPR